MALLPFTLTLPPERSCFGAKVQFVCFDEYDPKDHWLIQIFDDVEVMQHISAFDQGLNMKSSLYPKVLPSGRLEFHGIRNFKCRGTLFDWYFLKNFCIDARDVGSRVIQPDSTDPILQFDGQIRSTKRRFKSKLYFVNRIIHQIMEHFE